MLRGFINCHIWHSDAEAILISDDRIEKTGTNQEIKDALGSQDELIDVKGMYIVPGFIDSHMHLLELGYYLSHAQLSLCKSLDDIHAKLTANLNQLKEGEWLTGRGWNEENLKDHAFPDKKFLDTVSDSIPIAITRNDGHVMYVNSKALGKAGIQEDMELDDGYIDFDTGRVEENAIQTILKAEPEPDVQKLMDYVLTGMKYANASGITTVGSDDFLSLGTDYDKPLDAFEKLSYQDRLTIRIQEQCEFKDIQSYAKFLDDGYTFDVGNDFFRIGPLKLILDGSLGSHTAYMSKPYEDDKSTQGSMLLEDDEIEAYIQLAQHFNMPVIAHAIGDGALDHILDLYEQNLYEGNPLHSGIVHCQVMRKDQIEKVIKMKLSCYFQSVFIDEDAPIVEKRAGKDLALTSYPYKTLYEGTLSSNGSDAPVEMPSALKGIELAVTRHSISHPDYSMNLKECLSIDEAIASYTEKGAEQLFMQDSIGSVKEGYYADFVVLDQDITKCDVNKIHETKVMMTVMNGRTVYER